MDQPFRIAIVYPGDSEVRRLATPANNRFRALFAAFAAHGVEAVPGVYDWGLPQVLRAIFRARRRAGLGEPIDDGIGVWRVERAPDESAAGSLGLVRIRHPQRGSVETDMPFDSFVALMAPYFESGGHMIDQAWQSRMSLRSIRYRIAVISHRGICKGRPHCASCRPAADRCSRRRIHRLA